MDLGIIAGIAAGITLILTGIAVNSGSVAAFWDWAAILIVVGGTFASAFVHFRTSQMFGAVKVLGVALFRKKPTPQQTIRLLVDLAQKARREGLLALDEEAEELDDYFLRKGLRLVVDGADPETVRQILDIEITFLEERHQSGQQIFDHLGAVAPAFGMVGTVIGLIIMLGNLDNPESIGPAMAVALITTFYGVVLANLIFLPIAGKLRVISDEEVLMREVMIEGILSIQAGENPYIVEQKLESFLAPDQRPSLHQEQNAQQEQEDEEGVAATSVR